MADKSKVEEFDWIKLSNTLENQFHSETFTEKITRKWKENPFVPLGCLLTTSALTYGLWSFQKGNQERSQLMMRFRIGAQGFTVVALIVGLGMTAMRH